MKPADLTIGLQEIDAFPAIINVEVVRGSCPCQCVHCPVGCTPPFEREQRFGLREMSLDLYQRIVTECAGHAGTTLRVHAVGEPLAWRHLEPALAEGARAGVRQWVFTCGLGPTSQLEALARHAAIIEVSVNATTAADYLETKGIDAFAQVTATIEFLHRRGRGSGRRLLVSRTQTVDAVADRAFVAHWLASGLVDDAFIRSYHTYNDVLPNLGGLPSAPVQGPACLVHWARFNLSVDGQALLCFNELFKPTLRSDCILGDLTETSIAAIWGGERLQAIRRASLIIANRRQPDLVGLPCWNCSHCQPLGTLRQTSEHQVRCQQQSRPA